MYDIRCQYPQKLNLAVMDDCAGDDPRPQNGTGGGVVFWHVCPSYCQTICVWMYLLMVPAQLCFYGNIALTIPFQLQAQIWLWTPIPAQFSAEGLVSVFFAECILHIHQHSPPLPLLASRTDVVAVYLHTTSITGINTNWTQGHWKTKTF